MREAVGVNPPGLATNLEVGRCEADADAASITPVADEALEIVDEPPLGDRPVGLDAAYIVLVLASARIAHAELVLLHLKVGTARSGVKLGRQRLRVLSWIVVHGSGRPGTRAQVNGGRGWCKRDARLQCDQLTMQCGKESERFGGVASV